MFYFCTLPTRSSRVCWVGDYATEPDDFNFNLPAGIVRPNYKKVWGNRVNYLTCRLFDFLLDNKFLVNYDTRQFIVLNNYKAKSKNDDGWIIHPLPLLTAVGNGRGGGDFQDGVGIEFVGTWAWHFNSFHNYKYATAADVLERKRQTTGKS